MRIRGQLWWIGVALIGLALVVAACGGRGEEPEPESRGLVPVAEAHTEGDPHSLEEHQAAAEEGDGHGDEEEAEEDHSPGDHMAGRHTAPEEALELENPIPPTEESIARGAEIYARNCAVCHGAEGYGDGPSAAVMDPKPANLWADHVQERPDGALFWTITHGVPESPMPAWGEVLSEEDRWNLVNFLRTFQEE